MIARGSPRRWFRDLRLLWKLALPTGAVVITLGMTTLFVTTRFLASELRSEHDRTLVAAAVRAETLLHDHASELLEVARVLPNLEGMPESVEGRDVDEVVRRAAGLLSVRNALDGVVLTDASGHGIAELRRSAEGAIEMVAPADWSGEPMAGMVLAGEIDDVGDKRVGFSRHHEPVLAAVAPVKRGDRLVGTAVAFVGAGRLAADLEERSGGAVAIYDTEGALLRASSRFPDRLPAEERPSVEPVRVGWDPGESSGSALYQRVALRGSEPTAILGVGIRHRSVGNEVRGAAWLLAALVVLASGALVAALLLLTRGVLRQVRELVRVKHALGHGDLAARADVVAEDELGELARGMNQMAEQLETAQTEMLRQVAARTAELRRLYEETVGRLERQTETLGDIGHGFRNPLFVIISLAELMVDPELHPAEPDWPEEFGEMIKTSAEEMLRTVDDLLSLGRSGSAPVPLKPVSLDLAGLLSNLEPTARVLAGRADVSIGFQVADSLPSVRGDEDALRDVVLNLLSNALKYTPAGGRIALAATAEERGVVITVTDTGVGIPASALDRVFEPFYRVRRTSSQRGEPSTGLGLAITKRLVEAHRGTISVASEVGVGSTFRIWLPARSSRVSAASR